jgi:hypothetical protein
MYVHTVEVKIYGSLNAIVESALFRISITRMKIKRFGYVYWGQCYHLGNIFAEKNAYFAQNTAIYA